MAVAKACGAVALLLALSACGNNVENVFENGNGLSSTGCSGQAIPNRFIVEWLDGRITTESGENADSFKSEFVRPNLDRIKSVYHDRMIRLSTPPTTEELFEQNTPSVEDWGQQMIEVSALYDVGARGQGVLIGVVDSQIDVDHPQLRPRVSPNPGEIPGNGIDDDGNGFIDDYYQTNFSHYDSLKNGHGTHVSGIILADHEKGPVRGVAPEAMLIAAPFIGPDGSGSLGDAIAALNHVAARGAKIVNASWGGAPCIPSLATTFRELEKKGLLIVVAAGNSGRDIDVSPEYPASFSLGTQLTVAASSPSDFMANWSNSGFSLVNLAAPGVNIYSVIPGQRGEFMDGTSMAAPFVSGAAALLWSLRPQATARDIRAALIRGVDVLPYPREFKVSSKGRLNVRKAAEELLKIIP